MNSLNGSLRFFFKGYYIIVGIRDREKYSQVKAVASTRFNKARTGNGPLFWQEEYSVFSFDRKRLPYVIAYVEKQKEHHTAKTLITALEQARVAG